MQTSRFYLKFQTFFAKVFLEREVMMLSIYDALSFGVQKKSFLWGIFLSIFILASVFFTGYLAQEKFLTSSTIQAIQNGSVKSAFGVLRDSSFWVMLYPRVLCTISVILASIFVFFAQALIISKKKLFNLPPHFSLSFLIRTLSKLLILFLPAALAIYAYTHGVLNSVFSFVIRTVKDTNPQYKYPFPFGTTICFVSFVILYLYYSICLFIERFTFMPLLKISCFFRHLGTVLELMIAHIFSFMLLVLFIGILFFIATHMSSLYVCFAFIFFYLLTMILEKNARFGLLIPIFMAGIIILASYHSAGLVFIKLYWTQLFIATLIFNLFFIFIFMFMFLSIVAHLFAQTTFVFHFNKTPSSDIMDTSPEKLGRIEDLYDDYLRTHKNSKENFFDRLQR